MNSMPGPAFLLGGGMDEWALLGAIAFLLFGPKRLPEAARFLGRTLEKLRRAAEDFREQIAHLDDPPPTRPTPYPSVKRMPPEDIAKPFDPFHAHLLDRPPGGPNVAEPPSHHAGREAHEERHTRSPAGMKPTT